MKEAGEDRRSFDEDAVELERDQGGRCGFETGTLVRWADAGRKVGRMQKRAVSAIMLPFNAAFLMQEQTNVACKNFQDRVREAPTM